MGRKLAACVAAVSVCILNGQPQTQSTTPVSSQQTTTFSSGVTLVSVPVVVRDKSGKAIGDLTRDRFQLFDRGKRQAITSFLVEKTAGESTASTTQPPEHFIVYLFDDIHLTYEDLDRVRDAAWKNITESIQPSDRLAILTTSARTALDFTNDRDKLHDALMKIRPTPVKRAVANDCTNLPVDLTYQATRDDMNAKLLVRQLGARCFPTLMPQNNAPPGTPASQIAPDANNQSWDMAVEMLAQQVVRNHELETRLTFDTIAAIARRMQSLAGQRTIIFISPGIFVTDALREDEANLIDTTIRSKVLINSLDALGLWTPETTRNPKLDFYLQAEYEAGAATIAGLAQETGGNYVENSNDFVSGFRQLATVPEYIYLLGFTPNDLKANGGYHTLKIKVSEGASFTVQARRGYYAPKPGERVMDASRREIQDAVFSRDEVHDLPVALHTQVSGSGDKSVVTVFANVDVKGLRFRKVGDRNDNELTLISAVFDDSGSFLSGSQKVLRLTLRDQSMQKFEEQPIAVKSEFEVKPGTYFVRLVVRDSEDKMMTTENDTVRVP